MFFRLKMNMKYYKVCPECTSDDIKKKTFTHYESYICRDCDYCEEYDVLPHTHPPERSYLYKSIGYADTYLDQHKARAMYSRKVGQIPPGYELHHIDSNPLNNHITNLVALPREIHRLVHVNIKAFPNKKTFQDMFPDLNL